MMYYFLKLWYSQRWELMRGVNRWRLLRSPQSVYECGYSVVEEVIMRWPARLTVWWALVIRTHCCIAALLLLVSSLVRDLPAGLRRDGCGKGLSALQTQFYKKIYRCQADRRLCLSDGSTTNRPESVWHCWAKKKKKGITGEWRFFFLISQAGKLTSNKPKSIKLDLLCMHRAQGCVHSLSHTHSL